MAKDKVLQDDHNIRTVAILRLIFFENTVELKIHSGLDSNAMMAVTGVNSHNITPVFSLDGAFDTQWPSINICVGPFCLLST